MVDSLTLNPPYITFNKRQEFLKEVEILKEDLAIDK
jgi:hypothetical protein